MLRAVLVKGSPKFLKTELSLEYYQDITRFVEGLGIEVVEDGDVDDMDLIIAHGKAVPKIEEIEGQLNSVPVIKLGHPNGISHPKDLEWQAAGSKGIPPDEHLVFTADQKLAIQEQVDRLKRETAPVVETRPRQSASRRPSVR